MGDIKVKLNSIQVKLNVPKGQENKFGNFMYRSCEDILKAVKPLLDETELILTISDEIELIGERYYVAATARLQSGEETIKVKALAREPLVKKGMDEAQITGATSSYARKYALNGLFCIDDTADADTQKPDTSKGTPASETAPTPPKSTAKPLASQDKMQSLNTRLDKIVDEDTELADSVKPMIKKALLEKLTTFIGKEGRVVRGVVTMAKMSEARVKVTIGKADELYSFMEANGIVKYNDALDAMAAEEAVTN